MIAIVTPALAAANNGNWQTARRWANMLSDAYRTQVLARWMGEPADLLIALHARRSADSIRDWAARMSGRPQLVVLTGTDLYRDIDADAAAQRSLELADRLVVLNELGPAALPARWRPKTRVVLQSAPSRAPARRTGRRLRVLMVGHLREEKSPRTYFEAARLLRGRADILFDHIGNDLDAALGNEARQLMVDCPGYRWLGGLDHGSTRRRIAQAHLLAHASRMEGGAHVVIEAVRSGTPVAASDIAGNIGLLGPGYGGYFKLGDAAHLANLIAHCRDTQGAASELLTQLTHQCEARAALFSPQRESASLHEIARQLLTGS